MTSLRQTRLLVCAEEAAGVQLLRALRGRPYHRTVAVLTSPDAAAEKVTVASVARAMDIPLLPSELVRDATFAHWIRDTEIDLLLNVHSLHVADADAATALQTSRRVDGDFVLSLPKDARPTSPMGHLQL